MRAASPIAVTAGVALLCCGAEGGDFRLLASGTPERRPADQDVTTWLAGRTLAEQPAPPVVVASPSPAPVAPSLPEQDLAEHEDIIAMDIMPMRGLAPYFSPPESGIENETTPPIAGAPALSPSLLRCLDVGSPDPSLVRNGFSRTRPASIDYDGDPFAYAPVGSNLPTSDLLSNAGGPGNWRGIKTDNGLPTGNPLLRPDGYYTSVTSLTINGQPLNAQCVPYVALPKGYMGARLGDYARVTNESNGKKIWAIYADVSPAQELSELSAAAARGVGVQFERKGTTANASAVTVTIYPGSRNLDVLRQLGREQQAVKYSYLPF